MRKGLIAARKHKRWTQEKLAFEVSLRGCPLDRSSIAKYENATSDISGKVLKILAEVLNTPMDVLYEKTEPVLMTHSA